VNALAKTRFHAVGQGCFYSGEIYCDPKLQPFRLVYDCGSETSGDALDREVESFHRMADDEALGMLVLSHLDADHANGFSMLLRDGFAAKTVFLPYLTPLQRIVTAAGSGKEADPDYFELLADPIRFLETRGVQNIVFVGGGTDDPDRNFDEVPPDFPPSDADSPSPNIDDLEDDNEGRFQYKRLEPDGSISARGGHQVGGASSQPAQRANILFKRDRNPFRLNTCWQGKFFHRDDMRSAINAIAQSSDFRIRPVDPPSLQRYKRFLAAVQSAFGTLDVNQLITAIRDEPNRKKLKACYRCIRGNHNDVSLVLWHGPRSMQAIAFLRSGASSRGWNHEQVVQCNGGTLLTGDLTCRNKVVRNMERHLSPFLRDSAFLQVPHHGSVHSWNSALIDATSPSVLAIITAGRNNSYSHPHPEVLHELESGRPPALWCVSDERNTVSMRIES
jgi:beta-lactamase superfamily II metal-dependent hydrolase